MNKDNFTPLQLDLIKELANIGGGNAATSLSQLINKPTRMTVPTIEILDYNQVYKSMMAEETLVDAVIMKMLGDAEGLFLFVNTRESSYNLIKMMLDDHMEITDELFSSALTELVNILVSSFLNAVSKMIDVNLISSVPLYIQDMFGAILSSVYIESGQYDENVMIVKNEFFHQGNKIESALYFVPKPKVLESLFKTIGV